MYPGSLPQAWLFLRFYPVALLLGFFIFIFYRAEVNQLPGFYQRFICCSVELCHGPGFFYYYYFWRVEFKVACCSLEVLHEPGLFCVFTLWVSCLAFLFLSPIALKLMSFLDFINILSALARNYPTWHGFFLFFFYFWRVEVKVSCCGLEIFHECGFFCIFTLSGSLAWLFCFYLL